MKIHQRAVGVSLCLMLLASSPGWAGVIRSPTNLLAVPPGTINAGTTIDQSGLSAGFVSGVTDFATYLAGNPTHASPGPSNASSTPVENLPGSFDFDLGASFQVFNVALWNSFQGFGIGSFDILTASDSLFATAINVGSFNAVDTLPPMPAQVFALTPSVGQFVRLQINSNNGGPAVNLSEVVFDTASVPEPATTALMAVGLLVGGACARRQKRR